MFFTIEPMINLGKPHVKILSDGWTAVTRDRSLSAQFEHTSASPRPASRSSRCRSDATTQPPTHRLTLC
jgi:methionyl aminopeptidase